MAENNVGESKEDDNEWKKNGGNSSVYKAKQEIELNPWFGC